MNERDASLLAKSIAAECIAYRVRLVNRVITNIYDRALQPLGIKFNQANILTMLSLTYRATSADIARVLLMEKSTVSRTVARMKNNGWINVESQGDGTSPLVTVTPQGRKIMAAMHAQWEKAQQRASELLGEKGIAAVMMLHDTLRKGNK
jgi:DNA-binding MarR family transcriptional regulator